MPRSQWIVVPGTHEPIVDRETFEDSPADAAGPRSERRRRPGPPSGPGWWSAGAVGRSWEQTGSGSVRTDGARRRYLRCRTHQRAPERCSNKTCTSLDALQGPGA